MVRSMHCNPEFPADILPVDVAMNAIITAAWERGLNTENKDTDFRNIVSIREYVVFSPQNIQTNLNEKSIQLFKIDNILHNLLCK